MFFCMFMTGFTPWHAQGVTIGSSNPPHPAAGLDLDFSNKGLLLPRLTTVLRNAIQNPPAGLQIYNIDSDCIEFYFATGGWKAIHCGCSAFPNATFALPTASINNPATFQSLVPNMTYAWTFQSGSPATASTASAQVSWSSPGRYAVSLSLTDSAGCSATFVDSVDVMICQPSSYAFSNCGQTGPTGPSQTQCNNTYGAGVVTVNNGIQSWTVPFSGNYQITAAGARGGPALYGYTGGNGAVIQGTFSLNQGDVIQFVVGQMGVISTHQTYGGGGGGGGTYVVLNGSLILVAGGGGGASGRTSGPNGGAAQSGTSGASAIPHPSESAFPQAAGGTNGAGGNAGTGNVNVDGSGGGGYTGNGGGSTGGKAFVNGSNGGNGNGPGGFGGGGSSGLAGDGFHGGGGGGYSGGGGGSNSASASYGQGGGGGGSYNLGTNPSFSATNTGHGYLNIVRVCP